MSLSSVVPRTVPSVFHSSGLSAPEGCAWKKIALLTNVRVAGVSVGSSGNGDGGVERQQRLLDRRQIVAPIQVRREIELHDDLVAGLAAQRSVFPSSIEP